MAARFHPILDQVDGVKVEFELPEPFVTGSVVLAYNGQVYDKGVNIVAENPGGVPVTVTLSFAPSTDTHALMIIYEVVNNGGIRAFTYPPGGLLNDC